MQRLHEDDLAGHLLRQGGWDHLDLPAVALDDEIIELGHGKTHVRRSGDVLHPERESRDALEAIKAEVGSLLFSAQYQQRPVPVEGNLIRRSWFRAYDNVPRNARERAAFAACGPISVSQNRGRRPRISATTPLAGHDKWPTNVQQCKRGANAELKLLW
jgi:hypothetical protein